MSDYKGLEVVFEGDATGLQSALSQIDSTASTTESNLRNIGRALKVDPNNSQLLRMQGDEYKRLSDTARKRADVLAQAQDKANRKVEDSGSAYRKASSELDSAAASYDRLIRRHEANVSSIESLNRRIEKQRSSMTPTQRAADEAEERFSEQKSKLRGLRKSAKNLQSEMQGATAKADAEFANKGYRALADYYQKRIDVEDEFVEDSAGKSGSALAKQVEMRDASTKSLKAELSANIASLKASRENNAEVKRTTSAYKYATDAVASQERATTKAKKALEESTAALKKEGGEFNSTSKLIGSRNMLSLNDDSIMDQMEDTETRLADLQTKKAKRKLEWVHAQNDASRIEVEAVTNQKLADDYLQKSTKSYVESDLKGSRLYKFGQALDDFGQKAGAAADRSSKLSGRFSSLGQSAIMGLTVPLTVVGTKVTQLDEQFGSTMSQVKMYSGATKEQLGQLRDYALSLSSSSIYSSDEIGQAMNELAKAGQKPEQMMKKGGPLDSALSLAAAGQMDLADAAAKVVQVGSAFHIKTSDMTMVANVLANGANKSTAEVGDLANGLANCGQMAHTAGWSLKDTTAAIAFMADKGVDGATAGTQLKVMLQRLVNPTAKAQEVMEKYGFSARDAQGNVKDLSTLTQELYDKFGGLGAEERDSALGTMFGTRGINPVLALLNSVGDSANKGTGEIDGYIKACDTSKGATEMAAAQMSDYQKKITETKHSVENAGIALGESLEPNVEKGADLVKDLSTQFTKLDSGTKNGVANVLTGLTLFGPVFTMFQKGVQWGFAPLASGIGKVAKFSSTLAAYASETSVAGTATDAFALAADEAGINVAGLALGVKGLIAVAAVAGIAALVKQIVDYKQAQDDAYTATNGMQDALAKMDDTVDTGKSATERRKEDVEAYRESLEDAKAAHQDYIDTAKKNAEAVDQEVSSYVSLKSKLEDAGNTIEKYRGQRYLSTSQVQDYKNAVDTINKLTGSNFKVGADNSLIDANTGKLQENTQAVWDNIHARENQAKADVYSDAAQKSSENMAKAALDYQKQKKSALKSVKVLNDAVDTLSEQEGMTDRKAKREIFENKSGAYTNYWTDLDAAGTSAMKAAEAYRKNAMAADNLRVASEGAAMATQKSDLCIANLVKTNDTAVESFTNGKQAKAGRSLRDFAKTMEAVSDNSSTLDKVLNDPLKMADVLAAYDGTATSLESVFEKYGVVFDKAAAVQRDSETLLQRTGDWLQNNMSGIAFAEFASAGLDSFDDIAKKLSDYKIGLKDLNRVGADTFNRIATFAEGNGDTVAKAMKVAVTASAGYKKALKENDIDLAEFSVAAAEAGLSSDNLRKVGKKSFDSFAEAAGGDVDELVYLLKNYNDLKLTDKEGNIKINGDGDIVDANGHVLEWNGAVLIDKTAIAQVNGNITNGDASVMFNAFHQVYDSTTGKVIEVDADGNVTDGETIETIGGFSFAVDALTGKIVEIDAQGNVVGGTTIKPIDDTHEAITGLDGKTVIIDAQGNVVGEAVVQRIDDMSYAVQTMDGKTVIVQADGNGQLPATAFHITDTGIAIQGLDSNQVDAVVNGNAYSSDLATQLRNTAAAIEALHSKNIYVTTYYSQVGSPSIQGAGGAIIQSKKGGGGKVTQIKRGGIKRFAQGAIANVSGDGVTFAVEPDGTRDIYGEAGAEAIVPLTNKRYAQPFTDLIADTVVDRLGGVNTGGTNVYIDGARVNDDPAIRRLFIDFMQEMYRKAAMNRG